jgi:short-subunit dehydrogenase
MMSYFSGKTILLTGASGGIGKEMMHKLLEQGAKIVTLGRSPIEHVGVEHLTVDLSQDNSILGLESALYEFGHIDGLIHVAGVQQAGMFMKQSPEALASMMQTNLIAPTLLTRLVLPYMSKGSFVAYIGSVFGHIGFPYYAAYSASKFGLRGLSEALGRELEPLGIQVCHIALRAVNTPMNDEKARAFMKATGSTMDEVPEVVQAALKAIEASKPHTIIGGSERIFARLNGSFPKIVSKALRKATQAGRDIF